MGSVFFIHGVTTPGVFVLEFNPGVRWAAWLTLFLGGVTFAAAGLNQFDRPLSTSWLRTFRRALAAFILSFAGVVALAPEWLAWVDTQVAPWHQQVASV